MLDYLDDVVVFDFDECFIDMREAAKGNFRL